MYIYPSVFLVKETGISGENHRPAESYWHTLSHNVVASTWTGFELTLAVLGTDGSGTM